MKKYTRCIGIAALIALLLAGCNMFNQPGRTAAPTRWTPPGAPTAAISSLPPGKTASQDTAGAVTKLPEEATAAGVTAAGTTTP